MTTKESMHIDPYERAWIMVSITLVIVFTIAIAVAGFALGIQVPSPEQRVDPRTVATDPNSPWADPGLRELAPGKYEAYILAQTWQFTPREMTVPVGSTITLYVTSKDVQHGFKIQDTNVNMQIVPGQVSKLTVTFDKPGQYNYICTEYCGAAHAIMYGTITVEP
ncbi:MAG TPA: cytochrome C oxidase subunit II [Chloroflexi bacterium]|nr:cytochrome C oxidase subunit II [Chloroflexota bacterium]